MTPKFKMELPKFYKYFGLIVLIGISFSFIHQISTRGSDQYIGIIAFTVIFGFFGLILFLAGVNYQIEVYEEKLVQKTWYGKYKEINIQKIEDIKFGKISLELSMKSGQATVKIHSHMSNFEKLISQLNSAKPEFKFTSRL